MLERTLLVSGELAKEGVPVIAGGGINKLDEAKAILDTGAMAVQLDSVLWKANWNAADWEMTK
jgi:NAD(P)H-dependent flavin oxidoreductase YrpB (nitropropane dioxygenase family)